MALPWRGCEASGYCQSLTGKREPGGASLCHRPRGQWARWAASSLPRPLPFWPRHTLCEACTLFLFWAGGLRGLSSRRQVQAGATAHHGMSTTGHPGLLEELSVLGHGLRPGQGGARPGKPPKPCPCLAVLGSHGWSRYIECSACSGPCSQPTPAGAALSEPQFQDPGAQLLQWGVWVSLCRVSL